LSAIKDLSLLRYMQRSRASTYQTVNTNDFST
jgi:hypothetical protein